MIFPISSEVFGSFTQNSCINHKLFLVFLMLGVVSTTYFLLLSIITLFFSIIFTLTGREPTTLYRKWVGKYLVGTYGQYLIVISIIFVHVWLSKQQVPSSCLDHFLLFYLDLAIICLAIRSIYPGISFLLILCMSSYLNGSFAFLGAYIIFCVGGLSLIYYLNKEKPQEMSEIRYRLVSAKFHWETQFIAVDLFSKGCCVLLILYKVIYSLFKSTGLFTVEPLFFTGYVFVDKLVYLAILYRTILMFFIVMNLNPPEKFVATSMQSSTKFFSKVLSGITYGTVRHSFGFALAGTFFAGTTLAIEQSLNADGTSIFPGNRKQAFEAKYNFKGCEIDPKDAHYLNEFILRAGESLENTPKVMEYAIKTGAIIVDEDGRIQGHKLRLLCAFQEGERKSLFEVNWAKLKPRTPFKVLNDIWDFAASKLSTVSVSGKGAFDTVDDFVKEQEFRTADYARRIENLNDPAEPKGTYMEQLLAGVRSYVPKSRSNPVDISSHEVPTSPTNPGSKSVEIFASPNSSESENSITPPGSPRST